MKQYYLSDGLQPLGPFPLSELVNKGLSPTSLLWHDGLPEWMPATALDEVNALLPVAPLPPPLPPVQATPPPIYQQQSPATPKAPIYMGGSTLSSSGTKRTTTTAGQKDTRKFWIGGSIAAAILLLLGASRLFSSPSPYSGAEPFPTESSSNALASSDQATATALAEQQAAEQKQREEQAAAAQAREAKRVWHRAHFMEYVQPTVLSGYSVGSFGGISSAFVQFTNNSGYRLENIVVAVNYYKINGGIYKTEYVMLDRLGAHDSRVLRVPDSDRGSSISCYTQRLSAPGLDFAYDVDAVLATERD